MIAQVIGGVADLLPSVDRLLARATELAAGNSSRAGEGRIVGLAFLEPSLRTRVGFAVAAARLGGSSIEIREPRQTQTSNTEPWNETLRVLSGMVDVVVARPGAPFDSETTHRWTASPVVNGGDTGPNAEHPTQALVDVFAMEQMLGPLDQLAVALCGDLHSRTSRSLLRMLALRPPRQLLLATDAAFGGLPSLPEALRSRTSERALPNLDDVDVVCAMGMPNGAAGPDVRQLLRIDRRCLDRMSPRSIVLSPMPVLDEIETASLRDPRIRVYEQSDLGVFMRMAVLEALFNSSD